MKKKNHLRSLETLLAVFSIVAVVVVVVFVAIQNVRPPSSVPPRLLFQFLLLPSPSLPLPPLLLLLLLDASSPYIPVLLASLPTSMLDAVEFVVLPIVVVVVVVVAPPHAFSCLAPLAGGPRRVEERVGVLVKTPGRVERNLPAGRNSHAGALTHQRRVDGGVVVAGVVHPPPLLLHLRAKTFASSSSTSSSPDGLERRGGCSTATTDAAAHCSSAGGGNIAPGGDYRPLRWGRHRLPTTQFSSRVFCSSLRATTSASHAPSWRGKPMYRTYCTYISYSLLVSEQRTPTQTLSEQKNKNQPEEV